MQMLHVTIYTFKSSYKKYCLDLAPDYDEPCFSQFNSYVCQKKANSYCASKEF